MRPGNAIVIGLLLVGLFYGLSACAPMDAQGVRSSGPEASAAGQRAFAAAPSGAAGQERRVALVIGNGAYKEVPLYNPPNDAADMSAKLRQLGFRVESLTNADQRRMEEAVVNFSRSLGPKDVGLFYFAGHGIQAQGVNFLIPVAAEIWAESDLKYKAVNANWVLDQMNQARNSLNILILDACRDNPLGRGFKRSSGQAGLAPVVVDQTGTGTFIAFATAPGQTAEDGTGRNGTFTKHLLGNLGSSGLTLEQVFKQTRAGVLRETGGRQMPWDTTSVIGEFYFTGGPSAAASGPSVASPPPSAPSAPPSAPPTITAGGVSPEELIRQREQEKQEWAVWQKRMESEYAKAEQYEKSPSLTEKEKEELWSAFLLNFGTDNKYSTQDEVLRTKAQQRQAFWKNKRQEAEDKALAAERQKLEKEKADLEARQRREALEAEKQRLEQEKAQLEEQRRQAALAAERQKIEDERRRLEEERKKLSASTGSSAASSTAAGIIVKNNLEWYVGPDRNTTWDEARAWVAGLTVGGGGWRMPTRSELKGLYEPGRGSRNMDPAFQTTGWWVWSGEIKGSSSAWPFYFGTGHEDWYSRNDSYDKRAFAVRSRR
ncbi:MAG: caspase family protein [Thermodesulfobacteriota bacterium]